MRCQKIEQNNTPQNEITPCESVRCMNFWGNTVVEVAEEIRLMSATTTNAFGRAIQGRKNKYRIKLREHHGLETKNGFYIAVPIKDVCQILRISAVPQLIIIEDGYGEAIV